jgi:hypothetical protein
VWNVSLSEECAANRLGNRVRRALNLRHSAAAIYADYENQSAFIRVANREILREIVFL